MKLESLGMHPEDCQCDTCLQSLEDQHKAEFEDELAAYYHDKKFCRCDLPDLIFDVIEKRAYCTKCGLRAR